MYDRVNCGITNLQWTVPTSLVFSHVMASLGVMSSLCIFDITMAIKPCASSPLLKVHCDLIVVDNDVTMVGMVGIAKVGMVSIWMESITQWQS